jgi:hypothetical protein
MYNQSAQLREDEIGRTCRRRRRRLEDNIKKDRNAFVKDIYKKIVRFQGAGHGYEEFLQPLQAGL